jgi:hypothetical protein
MTLISICVITLATRITLRTKAGRLEAGRIGIGRTGIENRSRKNRNRDRNRTGSVRDFMCKYNLGLGFLPAPFLLKYSLHEPR